MPSLQPNVADVLELLMPQDIVSHRKCRIGPKADGGYVMFDALDGDGPVYSFGIGENIGFDEDFAERGRPVFMFDHTIEGLPRLNPLFHFMKLGISVEDEAANLTFSLDYFIRKLGHAGRTDLILKMDVEGAEWDVFDSIAPEVLNHFQQIVVEVHWLLGLDDPQFRAKVAGALRNLNQTFLLGHVHANNSGRLGIIDGCTVADMLELTYIRKDLAVGRRSTVLFPLAIDYGCSPRWPDTLMWFYPFLPEQPMRKVLPAIYSYGALRFIPAAAKSLQTLMRLRVVEPMLRGLGLIRA
jgi:hypothetical protein